MVCINGVYNGYVHSGVQRRCIVFKEVYTE